MSPFVRPGVVQPGDRTLARSVLFLVLAFYTATFAGLPDNPDAEVEYQTTSSLARRGSLALDPDTPLARAAIDAGHGVRPGGPGREHESFAWFGVGQAVVALPFWYAGHGLARLFPGIEEAHRQSTWYGVAQTEYFEHLLVGWRNPLLGALTAWLVVLSSRRLGARRVHAWVAGLGYGLCTFAWPQARSSLSGVQATFFLFLAFHLQLVIRERYTRMRGPSIFALGLGGLALAAALATRIATAPAVAVLAVSSAVIFWRARVRRGKAVLRQASLYYAMLTVGVGALLYTNHARFGNAFETGYGAVLSGTYFSYPPLQGLAALFVSPGRGLLWMAPGVLLFPVALFLVRQRDALAVGVILGVTLVSVALVAPTQGWHGAHTYGPRYLLPCLPFLWLGVGPALDAFAAAKRPLLGHALVFLGLLTCLPGVLVGYGTHHDLAIRTARIAWPDEELGLDPTNAEEERFQRIQWRWNFAAPWAHWRILRQRVAGLGEDFPLRAIFFVDESVALAPTHERDRGFRHLGWVDFKERLGGPLWPISLFCSLFLALGLVFALAGLDPGAS